MNKPITTTRLFLSFAALALLSSAAVAQPQWPVLDHSSITVSYADLNLSSPAGVRTLHRRIDNAARDVCGQGYESIDLEFQSASGNCYRTAVKNAMKKVRGEEHLAAN